MSVKTKSTIKAKNLLCGKAVIAFCFFLPFHTFAQTGFTGPREDDQPIFEGFLTHIMERNEHAGVASIANLDLTPGETVVRIYEGFGQQPYRRGGHPLTLFEFHQKQGTVQAVFYPPCPPGSEELLEDAEDLWETLLEQDIFSVKDSRLFPDYPRILDGTSYIVQIKAEGRYREYYVSNPQEYSSPDNARLLAVLSEARRQFGTPSCFTP